MKVLFVLVLSYFVFVDARKAKSLPSYIKACSKSSPNFDQCVLANAKEALPHILKGDKSYRIPVLTPLHLEKVEVKPSDTFDLILTNLDVHGIDNLKIQDIKIDLKKHHVEVVLKGDGIKLLSDYKVSGQILVLPISGNGKADLRFDGCTFRYIFDYNLNQHDGKEYVSVKESKTDFTINKSNFHLDNLFNGNKELGDNMNKVMNENSEVILKDFGPAIKEVINGIASGLVKSFVTTIPYDEIFLP